MNLTARLFIGVLGNLKSAKAVSEFIKSCNQAVRDATGAYQKNAEGANSNGEIALIRSNLPTLQRAKEVLAHELLGHSALKVLLGGHYSYALRAFRNLVNQDPEVRKIFASVNRAYDSVYSRNGATDAESRKNESRRLLNLKLEEVGARLAEQYKESPNTLSGKVRSIFDNLKLRVRNILRNWGLNIGLGELELSNLFRQSKDAIAKEGRWSRTGSANNGGNTMFSAQGNNTPYYDFSKPFADQIDDLKKTWNGTAVDGEIISADDNLLVGETPKVFRDLGLAKLPVTYNQEHIRNVLDKANAKNPDPDHDITESVLKRLPEIIQKPLAIITSKTRPNDSIVAILTEINPSTNKRIIFAAETDGLSSQNGLYIDSLKMNSAYSKKNDFGNMLKEAIDDENSGKLGVYYLDKKNTIPAMANLGHQLPNIAHIPDGIPT